LTASAPREEKRSFFSPLRKRIYLLILLNLLVFGNTFQNRFTYDDVEYIKKNPHVQSPENLISLFTHPYPPHRPELSLYRPLVEVTYLIDWCSSLRRSEFADLAFNDTVAMPLFHLTNVFYHIAATIALFFLVRLLYKNDSVAFFAALIFSIHPVHVENVTSIVGRAESMCALFFLLSLLLFIREWGKENLFTPYLFLSYLFFFLSLLSKESAITLPPVILIADWYLWARKRREEAGAKGGYIPVNLGRGVIRTLPYGVVFLSYLILRLEVVQRVGITPSHWYFVLESTGQRLAAMCVAALVYLRLLIFPVAMSADYNFPVRIFGPIWANQPSGFMNFWVLSGIFLLIVYVFITIQAIRKKSPFAFPLLFFPVTMFPFSNIIPFGDFMAERFLYLPSVGFVMIVGLAIQKLRRGKERTSWVLVLLCLLVAGYSIRTVIRNRDWRSGIALWTAEMKQNPKNLSVYSSLGSEYSLARKDHLIKGNAYREKGQYVKSAQHLKLAREYEDTALEYFEEAVVKNPGHHLTYFNYGGLCMEMRNPDYDRSEDIFLRGAGSTAANAQSLHVFYYYIGLLNLKRVPPRPERALFFLQKAHGLKRSQDSILTTMAAALGSVGRYGDSREAVREVLERDPANKKAIKIIRLLRQRELATRSGSEEFLDNK